MMGRDSHSLDNPLCFGILQTFPSSCTQFPVLLTAHFVEEKDFNHISVHLFSCLLDGLLHVFITSIKTFGDNNRVEISSFESLANIWIGLIILCSVEKIDASFQCIANQGSSLRNRQIQ